MTDVSTPGTDADSSIAEPNGVAATIETNGDTIDSDDDIQAKPSRKHAALEDDDEVPEVDSEDEDAGGLFGSGSEDEGKRSSKRRKLSDEELDSGDDDARQDRTQGQDVDMEDEYDEPKATTLGRIDLTRHGMPRGSDGELYLLRNPQFLGIEAKAFAAQSFRPPTTGHHGAAPTSAFMASQVANNTVRWKRHPNKLEQVQSNTRILRWSDGSLTLQMGADPTKQHELPTASLAHPRLKPAKPIPTTRIAKSTAYDNRLESHTYLASLHSSVGFLQVTNHLTASLTVQTADEEEDEALIRLQEAMSAASKSNKGEDGQGPGIISINEDPELAKRKAEVAEREKMRAERRRQNQVERERDRANRAGVPSRSRANGLTVGGLEDEDGMPARGKPKPARRARRRGSEYSSDEEEGYRRGKTKEDEYDEDDGFLVGDEEEEIVEDASEEEEEFGEADAEGEDEEEAPKPSKAEEAKPAADEGEDAGAGGRGRRRRVVDEDDEE